MDGGAARQEDNLDEPVLEDQVLTCSDCGREFTFTVQEQQYFSEQAFDSPTRCTSCQQAKRDQRKAEGPRRRTFRPKRR